MGLLGRRASSRTKRGEIRQPTCYPLPMRAAAEPGLEVEPVGEAGKADAPASTTTMVEVATSNRVIHNRCTPGSNTSRPHGSDSSHNIRPYGSSSSSSCSSSSDIRSHNNGDGGISSSTPGLAGRDLLHKNSTGAEHLTSGDNDIGEEISRTGTSGACISGAARRSTSLQSTGQLRPHQRRSIVSMRHHLQEPMSRSTAPVLLPRGHRTTAIESTVSSYGPPPPHDSYTPALPMPPPPTPDVPPPPAPPSESD